MANRLMILEGVEEDVANLLSKFGSLHDLSFSAFAKVWNEMQFYFFFSGRTDLAEIEFLINEVFKICLTYIHPSFMTWERVGSIYLMYSIFFSQPLVVPISIRIEKDEYVAIRTLVESIKKECPWVCYCYLKLITSHAFYFVILKDEMSLESYNDSLYTTNKEKEIKSDNITARTEISKIFKKSEFSPDKWREHETKYNSLKKILGEKCNAELKTRDFVGEIIKPLFKFQEMRISDIPASEPVVSKETKKKVKGLNQLVRDGVDGESTEEPEDFRALPPGASQDLPILH